jgi:predicted nucleic acid-binding protein
MRVLLDTNIILDVLLDRDERYEYSFNSWKIVADEHFGYIAGNSIDNIFYILRKN